MVLSQPVSSVSIFNAKSKFSPVQNGKSCLQLLLPWPVSSVSIVSPESYSSPLSNGNLTWGCCFLSIYIYLPKYSKYGKWQLTSSNHQMPLRLAPNVWSISCDAFSSLNSSSPSLDTSSSRTVMETSEMSLIIFQECTGPFKTLHLDAEIFISLPSLTLHLFHHFKEDLLHTLCFSQYIRQPVFYRWFFSLNWYLHFCIYNEDKCHLQYFSILTIYSWLHSVHSRSLLPSLLLSPVHCYPLLFCFL